MHPLVYGRYIRRLFQTTDHRQQHDSCQLLYRLFCQSRHGGIGPVRLLQVGSNSSANGFATTG
jgi:hypothetical protein